VAGAPVGWVGDYAARIDSEDMWRALAARPEHEATARTESVKTIIDLADHGRLYFLESKRWFFHYHFTKEFIDPIHSLSAFNEEQYHSADRRFILGEIVHYRDQDIWAFELAWLDELDVARTVESFHKIQAAMWIGDKLRYHPVPTAHLASLGELRRRIPIATSDEIFGGTRYQAVNPGEAFGTLRFLTEPFDATKVAPHDIVVLDGAPLDLPVCAGVITSQFQAPLSHVAVLSANRHTPDMTLRGASSDPALRRLEGKLVRLQVTLQDFAIDRASDEEAERAWKQRRPGSVMHLRRKDKDVGLPTLTEFNGSDTALVGAKAAQLGELRRFVPASMLPRAFAVPFHDYVEHLRRNGIDAELDRILADASFRDDRARRERALAQLRERIEHAPVNAALVTRIRDKIGALFPGTRVRFRSSTNAEDLPGFNGAGLYSSTIAPAHATDEQIADALRKVWASVWSFQGFEERSYFGIAAREVGMAVLVQESVDDIAGIGVAITANPYDRKHPGVLINVQDPGGSVTSPAAGEVPEQVLVHTWPELSVERISSSSRSGGQQLMSCWRWRACSSRSITTSAATTPKIHTRWMSSSSSPARSGGSSSCKRGPTG
jgi:rifampicin phosphotransferase